MKKIITTALIAAMLTASLAGCSGNTDSDNSGANSGNSSTVSNTGNTSSTDSNTSSDAANSGDNSGANSGDNSSTPVAEGKSPAVRLQAMFNKFPQFFDVNSEEGFMSMIVAGSDENAIKEVFPDPTDPEKPAHCVFAVQDSGTLAPMMELTQLNLGDCEDYILAAPMMSASLKRIVIVKPKAGKEETVKSALSAYADAQKVPQPMEYPAWEEERAGTHFGETDDGCYYVVVAAEGADMGSAIENA